MYIFALMYLNALQTWGGAKFLSGNEFKQCTTSKNYDAYLQIKKGFYGNTHI